MFRKSNFIFILYFLVQSTGSANVKPQNSSVKSVLSNSHGPPQSADQTFNINNWGLGKIERKLLIDIKAKIDALSNKVLVAGPACTEGWIHRGKSCYLIVNIPTLKWSDARRTCQNLGGDLAIIKSADENKFIFDLTKKQKTVTSLGVWLGLYRKADSKFYWIDDTPLAGQYSDWGRGEPSSPAKEKCGNMFGTGGRQGKWNDLYCDVSQANLKYAPSILCQKKSN